MESDRVELLHSYGILLASVDLSELFIDGLLNGESKGLVVGWIGDRLHVEGDVGGSVGDREDDRVRSV